MSQNHLARETSPYLLQHKDNPVQWWAWGPEALAESKRTGKPILLLNVFKLIGLNAPSFDYALSDYWHKKEHPLEHEKIKRTFEQENYSSFERKDYHLKRTWISNLIFPLYTYFCKPETSYWLAKK